jgi:hypothetical protein
MESCIIPVLLYTVLTWSAGFMQDDNINSHIGLQVHYFLYKFVQNTSQEPERRAELVRLRVNERILLKCIL